MKWLDIVRAVADVLIVTFLFYKTIIMVQGTRAIEILKGILIVLLIWILSGVLGLETLKFILSQVILYGLLGIMIIFQPELRNALEKLGRQNLRGKGSSIAVSSTSKMIDDIVKSVEYMSIRHIGALISIEMKDNLSEYIKTGIRLNAEISKELLMNIFTPNVPLHDGALIIKDGRIEAASCYLPLSERMDIPKELGTRHRAGIGLSEVTDAVTVIVSEETGSISLTHKNELYRGITIDELRKHLEVLLSVPDKEKAKRKPLFRGFRK